MKDYGSRAWLGIEGMTKVATMFVSNPSNSIRPLLIAALDTGILNINLHRKDSKKSPMLHKWIAFSFELHVSVRLTMCVCVSFLSLYRGESILRTNCV